MGGIDSYVMDVEVAMEEKTTGHCVRLIELNAFGAEFSSGSALYHWLRDDHILRGEDLKAESEEDASIRPALRKVYFRVLYNSEV